MECVLQCVKLYTDSAVFVQVKVQADTDFVVIDISDFHLHNDSLFFFHSKTVFNFSVWIFVRKSQIMFSLLSKVECVLRCVKIYTDSDSDIVLFNESKNKAGQTQKNWGMFLCLIGLRLRRLNPGYIYIWASKKEYICIYTRMWVNRYRV